HLRCHRRAPARSPVYARARAGGGEKNVIWFRGQATFSRFEKIACSPFFFSSAPIVGNAIRIGRTDKRNSPPTSHGGKSLPHAPLSCGTLLKKNKRVQNTHQRPLHAGSDSNNSSSERELAGQQFLCFFAYVFDPIFGLTRAHQSEPPICPSGSVALLWKRLS